MQYDEWLDDLKYKLNKTYKIRNIVYDEINGMRIDFENNFHYGINYTMLWNFFIYSKWDDYFAYITNMIDINYLSLIKNI